MIYKKQQQVERDCNSKIVKFLESIHTVWSNYEPESKNSPANFSSNIVVPIKEFLFMPKALKKWLNFSVLNIHREDVLITAIKM